MNRLFLCLTFVCLVAACKKKDPVNPPVNNPDLTTADHLASIISVQNEAAELYGNDLEQTQDSVQALAAVAQWLLDQTEVDKVYAWSPQLLEVQYTSGLKSYVSFISQDANDQDMTRGSGSGTLRDFRGPDTEDIKNEKVLILNPYIVEFNQGVYNKDDLFSGGPKPLEITVANGESVNYQLLNTFGDYGFIILNTHGTPDGFTLSKHLQIALGDVDPITKQQVEDLLVAQGVPIEKLQNGELVVGFDVRSKQNILTNKVATIVVTDKFIRNASFSLDDAVVFGNHCYSGFTQLGPTTSNLAEAYRSKGVNTYYGYAFESGNSQIVTNDFAMRMEDSIIVNLAQKGDTTGVAHLAQNSALQSEIAGEIPNTPQQVSPGGGLMFQASIPTPLVLTHFYETNYSYAECGDTLVDDRDGQTYATVCIGNQVWMAENLNWAGAGLCYDNNGSNCSTYGRLYNAHEATNDSSTIANPSEVQGVCPTGWHVPSKDEWLELVDFLGGASVAGGKMKSTTGWSGANVGATNSSGFNALPSGYADHQDNFIYIGLGDAWWSATSSLPDTYYLQTVNTTGASTLYANKLSDYRHSVRCVKD